MDNDAENILLWAKLGFLSRISEHATVFSTVSLQKLLLQVELHELFSLV